MGLVQGFLVPMLAPGSFSDAMGGDLPEEELTPYPDEDDVDDWDFFDAPVDSHIDVMLLPVQTSTPFVSYAAQLALLYLRTIEASSSWCCKTRMLSWRAILRLLRNLKCWNV